jgi:hypothetical protein
MRLATTNIGINSTAPSQLKNRFPIITASNLVPQYLYHSAVVLRHNTDRSYLSKMLQQGNGEQL